MGHQDTKSPDEFHSEKWEAQTLSKWLGIFLFGLLPRWAVRCQMLLMVWHFLSFLCKQDFIKSEQVRVFRQIYRNLWACVSRLIALSSNLQGVQMTFWFRRAVSTPSPHTHQTIPEITMFSRVQGNNWFRGPNQSADQPCGHPHFLRGF